MANPIERMPSEQAIENLIIRRKSAPFINFPEYAKGTPKQLGQLAKNRKAQPEMKELFGEYNVIDLSSEYKQAPGENGIPTYYFGDVYVCEEHPFMREDSTMSKFWILHFLPFGATSKQQLEDIVKCAQSIEPQNVDKTFSIWQKVTGQLSYERSDQSWVSNVIPRIVEAAHTESQPVPAIMREQIISAMDNDFKDLPVPPEVVLLQPTKDMDLFLKRQDEESELFARQLKVPFVGGIELTWYLINEPSKNLHRLHDRLKLAISHNFSKID